jgi:hypothetical protein
MKIHEGNIKRLTIVTALGTILQTGEEGGGVLIVDSENHKPVLEVSEVSDDETVNLFLHVAPHAGLAKVSELVALSEGAADSHIVSTDEVETTHEILVLREDHKPLRDQNGSPVAIAAKE